MAKKTLKIVDSREKPTEVEIDLLEIERMGHLNMTQEEIAYIKGVWPETITRWKEKHEEINQAIIAGKAKSKGYLIDKVREIVPDGQKAVNVIISRYDGEMWNCDRVKGKNAIMVSKITP